MDVMITPHQRVFAVLASVVVFLLILELVRRRRLREEYSWLWLLTGAAMIVLVVWYRLLLFITWVIGAVSPVTTLLLFSSLFLLAIAIHYSVVISKVTTQVKNLAQELALLAGRIEGPQAR
ncbi:MAG: DUF2304 domain-containing protein [Candidatus Methylomirabilia bacterium]